MRSIQFYLSLILFITIGSVQAKQCKVNKDFLSAKYEITVIDKSNGKKQKNHLTIWRMGNQVAHEHENSNITEIWHKTANNRVMLMRYFEQEKQGIEYQPSEIKTSNHDELWQQKAQIVSNHVLDHFTRVKTSGKNCDMVIHYKDNSQKTNQLKLAWLEELNLPKNYQEESETKSMQWNLVSIDFNKSKIETFFDQRDRYQTTDYADIGDNESDPFLLKMINIGFIQHSSSGFYDAAGNHLAHSH